MRTPKGTESVSVETAVFSVLIVMLGQMQTELVPLITGLLVGPKSELPDPDELIAKIQPSLKQAVELVSIVEVLGGFFRNRTARNAVAFLYLVLRYVQFGDRKPSRQQSIQLWLNVWDKAKEFPLVASEWEVAEAHDNLRGWKTDVQESARRHLRTVKNQLPRIEKNSAVIYNKILTLYFGDDSSAEAN
jgi:hypothetical protein